MHNVCTWLGTTNTCSEAFKFSSLSLCFIIATILTCSEEFKFYFGKNSNSILPIYIFLEDDQTKNFFGQFNINISLITNNNLKSI